MSQAADSAAVATIVHIGIDVGFTTIPCSAVAILEAASTRRNAYTVRACGITVRVGASDVARAAVIRGRVEVGLAAIGRNAITITEPGIARDATDTSRAARPPIIGAARVAANAAVVDIIVGVQSTV